MANADIKVVIKKQFAFRGGTQVWSNSYHANGGTPADNTAWDALFDAIVNAEKLATSPACTIIEAVGYIGAATIATHSKAYTTVGTNAPGTGTHPQAGEVVGLVRYATAARTTKGHPVYLFNYYHSMSCSSTDVDTLAPGLQTALNTYAAAWLTGFSDGTNTYVRAGPRGANATSKSVETLLTHRDFPR